MNRTPRLNLLIVIVNYRTAALVIACLRSLEREVKATAARLWRVCVTVTDNASGDASVRRLQEAVRQLRLERVGLDQAPGAQRRFCLRQQRGDRAGTRVKRSTCNTSGY